MASYDSLNSTNPYGSGDPYYSASTGYITPQNPRKPLSKWIKFGVPVGILVIAAAVVAAVVATHRHHSSSTSSGSPAAASSAISAKDAVGIFPTATDSEYMVPIYPSTVRFQ